MTIECQFSVKLVTAMKGWLQMARKPAASPASASSKSNTVAAEVHTESHADVAVAMGPMHKKQKKRAQRTKSVAETKPTTNQQSESSELI